MSQVITAVYTQGVLRPLTPLNLSEQMQVELEVRPLVPLTAPLNERNRVLQALAEAGVICNRPFDPIPPSPLSEEEELELAESFAGEPPLSELIIEERQQGW